MCISCRLEYLEINFAYPPVLCSIFSIIRMHSLYFPGNSCVCFFACAILEIMYFPCVIQEIQWVFSLCYPGNYMCVYPMLSWKPGNSICLFPVLSWKFNACVLPVLSRKFNVCSPCVISGIQFLVSGSSSQTHTL